MGTESDARWRQIEYRLRGLERQFDEAAATADELLQKFGGAVVLSGCTITFEFTVTDGITGLPVSGVTVDLISSGMVIVATGTTDAGGLLTLIVGEEDTYSYDVYSSGYGHSASTLSASSCGDTTPVSVAVFFPACDSTTWPTPFFLTTNGNTYTLTGAGAPKGINTSIPGTSYAPTTCALSGTIPITFTVDCDPFAPFQPALLLRAIWRGYGATGCDGSGTNPCTYGASGAKNRAGDGTVTGFSNSPVYATGTWAFNGNACASFNNPLEGLPWVLSQ